MAGITSDILLFCATATLFTWHRRSAAASSDSQTCDVLRNSAFVFVKPHANTVSVQDLVRTKLTDAGIKILSEVEIPAATIDEKKLIDQHYYAIASKATILPATDIPVPKDKFQEAFGESYDAALKEGRVCNAMEACKAFGCSPEQLDEAWQKTTAHKFGGGFYCGLVALNGKSLYVFNAFFMSMRSKFIAPGTSIYCYEVEWLPERLPWSDFRGKVLGPTDPSQAPAGSLRQLIFKNYAALGLKSVPNKGDNGVHASASPFEGLAEKSNWLGRSIEAQPFGKALLDAGLPLQTLKDWSVDPRIVLDEEGSMGSVFDALEDLDVADCLAKMVHLNELSDMI